MHYDLSSLTNAEVRKGIREQTGDTYYQIALYEEAAKRIQAGTWDE